MTQITCSKCILHSRIPGVTVNPDGVCSTCSEYDNNPQVSAMTSRYFNIKFQKLLSKVREEKHPYGALVLFSGGKDSTYLLKLVKEQYGLNPLAFAVKHPLVNTVASQNMEDVADKLGVDLLKLHPTEKMYKKLMKFSLLEGHKYGADECIGCATCSFIFKHSAFMTALRMNIPLVFDGTDRDQSDTPVYLEGEKLKEEAAKGNGPFGKMHRIFSEALGEEYRGTIYDFNSEELKNADFPSFISPFTFIDYDFKQNFKEIEELGLSGKNFKTVFTNCDAVPFFSFFSLKRFDCLTYVRHYAAEIRKGYPYFVQSKLVNDENDGALSRETIQNLLDEYKKVVLYIVENKLDKSNTGPDERRKILGFARIHHEIYGPEVCEIFLDQALMVNPYARFFDIDLAGV